MKDWLKAMMIVLAVVTLIVAGACNANSYVSHNACLQAGYSDVKGFGGALYCIKLQDGHLYGTELATLTEAGQ